MNVRFSVLVPTYNRRILVRETIDSVLRQTFPDYELFVIDDGSTDGTMDLLNGYGPRINVIQQRNRGPEVARNAAAARAEGEYLALLDSDDMFFPSTLGIYDQVIRAFNSPPVVIGKALRYDNSQPVPADPEPSCDVEAVKFKDYISKTTSVSSSSSVIVLKKSVFDEIGGLRNSTPLTFHNDDFNLVLKTGTYGPCVAVHKPHTVLYRSHLDNSMKNIRVIANALLDTARSERRGEFPGGKSRRRDRYAVIGGRSASWAINGCWKAGRHAEAVRLLFGTAPMVAVASWRKFWGLLRPRPQAVTLSRFASLSETNGAPGKTLPEAAKALRSTP
jgi:glycosyltransferase involved in cell wall biosynthesis